MSACQCHIVGRPISVAAPPRADAVIADLNRATTLDELAAAGVSAGTIRLSIGLEDITDILADLERGLAAAAAV